MKNKMQQEIEEYLLDETNGCEGKKPILSSLNKTKLSNHKMDVIYLVV